MSSDLTIPDTHDIAAWVEAIKLIDTDEPVIGGIDGVSNAQAIQLAQRAQWLKAALDKVVDAAGGVDATTDNLDQLRQAIDALIAGAAPGTATTTAAGLVELATATEARTGTDATRAVTPAGLAAALGTLQDVSAAIAAHAASRDHPAATTSAQGLVELATTTETQAGTDTARAVTPAGLAAALDGFDADKVDGYEATDFLRKGAGYNSAYYYLDHWLELQDSYGLYSKTNNAHFLPNTANNNGAWVVSGTRGSWGGFNFSDQQISLLVDSQSMGGYSPGIGWQWRFQDSKLVAGTVPWERITGAPAQPIASTTVAGIVELATLAETRNGTDTARAVTPKSMADTLGQGGYMRRDQSETMAAGKWAHRVTLDGSTGTATPVLANGNIFDLDTNNAGSVDRTVTLAYPNPVPSGGMFIIEATQNGAGGHGLTLAAGYRVMQGTWSTDAGATNVLWCTIGKGGAVIDVVIGQRGEV